MTAPGRKDGEGPDPPARAEDELDLGKTVEAALANDADPFIVLDPDPLVPAPPPPGAIAPAATPRPGPEYSNEPSIVPEHAREPVELPKWASRPAPPARRPAWIRPALLIGAGVLVALAAWRGYERLRP